MKSTFIWLGCLALFICGCGPKLAGQRDLALEVGDIRAIPIDPITREQVIKITASSPDTPINVHVYLQENEEEIERKITFGKPPENLLASETDANEVSLEATVPANKEAVVRLQSAGRETAKVHLEISN